MKMKINIFSENIHKSIKIDEKKALETARKILTFYLNEENIFKASCLKDKKFNCISFDILYCDNEKTHQINKEYRGKDYPADIITFAIFADSDEKFIFDKEINLGEIIISLDKVEYRGIEVLRDGCMAGLNSHTSIHPAFQPSENELDFLISHGIMHLLGFDHQTNEEYTFIVEAQNSALQKVKGNIR